MIFSLLKLVERKKMKKILQARERAKRFYNFPPYVP